MKGRHICSLGVVFSAAALWLASSTALSAYNRWGNGCTDCHGDFRDSTSTKPNNTWPDDKYVVHRRSMTNDLCGICHVNIGDDPLLNLSAGEPGLPGLSCMGCHGLDPDPTTQHNSWWGAGLRLYHANANVGTDNGGLLCVDCHDDDPAPLGENAVPVYYGGTDVNIFDPSNGDDSENWTSDGLGLDNGGDLDYDAADADCSSSEILSDGFGSGDTSSWSLVVP